MTSKDCSINQVLPVEIIQEILVYVTDIQDIKSYRLSCKLWHVISNNIAKAEIHVMLDSRVRSAAFVNDLIRYSFIGPRVDKLSVTTGQCDILDLKNISSFCMNLKKIHFGQDVDMNKYFKLLYSNQIKLPNLQEIKIPKPTSLHNGIFALGIYFRFHKTLANLELSIDPTLNQLLRRNYGGLTSFVSNFKQLKTLQLNYTSQEGMNFFDLQPLFSKFSATLQSIVIDGIGELFLRNLTNDKYQQENGLTKIKFKGDVIDVQHLLLTINALKRSSDVYIISKCILYSSYGDKFDNTISIIMEGFLAYYQDLHLINIDIAQCNPMLLINQNAINACKWIMTSTDSYPYMLYWRNENW